MSAIGKRTCIYCGLARPFTDEHVFPAGLGGDDRRFLLKDLVCGQCNTGVFSKLEAQFMRASPAAIGRIFLQARGRGRGKKASIPTIETRTTTVFFEGYGAVEAEVTTRGKAIPLLQLLFLGEGKIGLVGSDHGDPDDFLNEVESTLTDSLFVVRKYSNGVQTNYRVEMLAWNGAGYSSVGDETLSTPPSRCVWREPLEPAPSDNVIHRAPSFYKRMAGQMTFRMPEDAEASFFLTQARKAASTYPRQTHQYTTSENRLVQVSMSMNVTDYGRVLAKIGLNLLAYVFGDEYARHHAFKKTKRAILVGDSHIPVHRPPMAEDVFNGVPADKHALLLYFTKSRAGRFHVALFIRLYGATHVVPLSSNAVRPPDQDALLVVDYNQHHIELYTSIRQFVAAYPPNRPEGSVSWQSVFGSALDLNL